MMDFVCLAACSRVSLRYSQYHGDPLNWDQPFTVSASCDECNAAPQHVRFSWMLYLVDVSSKPTGEGNKGGDLLVDDSRARTGDATNLSSLLVPFCYAADLSAPAAVMGPYSPRTSAVSHSLETFVPLAEDVFETAAKKREAADRRNETAEVNRVAPGIFKPAQ